MDYRQQPIPPRNDEERTDLKNRIIARFDASTGSSGAATFGPLVDAILAELFPADPPIQDFEKERQT